MVERKAREVVHFRETDARMVRVGDMAVYSLNNGPVVIATSNNNGKVTGFVMQDPEAVSAVRKEAGKYFHAKSSIAYLGRPVGENYQ